jgi:predicted nucleic acid-binding protein
MSAPAMILVDTNVVSELMRAVPAPAVLSWFDEQEAGELYFSAVGEAELRTGAAILPEGKRRDRLIAEVDAMIAEDFTGRVLPFDSVAAKAYAAIAASRRAAGRPITQADCQIAAIARAAGAALATRNVRDFQGCGIEVVDPWNDQ